MLLASPVVLPSSLIAPVWFTSQWVAPCLWVRCCLDWNELAHSGNVKLIVSSVTPAGLPCLLCWEPESLVSRAGSGWEERERVRAPFVWLGRASGALLAEAGTGLLLGPRVTASGPGEVWS